VALNHKQRSSSKESQSGGGQEGGIEGMAKRQTAIQQEKEEGT
jgi:hypothetical protein